MALSRRRSDRFSASIWPGFVDAMTALLLVLMFVLSIFMIVQFMLRETITGQESELDLLHDEISQLADALGLERRKSTDLERQVGVLDSTLTAVRDESDEQARLIAALSSQVSQQEDALAEAAGQISDFEARVAALLLERNAAQENVAELEATRASLLSERDAMATALASAREEVDLQAEQARLAAARREALEALVADLRVGAAEADELRTQLSEEEAARLAEAAAAQALRERLKGAEDELTAMTLALEAQRRKAEETLTLLAAAQAAESTLDDRLAAALEAQSALEAQLGSRDAETETATRSLAEAQAEVARLTEENERLRADTGNADEVRRQLTAALAAKLAAETAAEEQMSLAEQRAALLAAANRELEQKEADSAESQRRMALLNENISSLRNQLASLEGLLDAAEARDEAAQVEIQSLGTRLNSALARVAAEERARAGVEADRARLEENERKRLEEDKARLEAEARDLKSYRSEFFGRLRDILGGREGVRIEGDRFVFSSEVLFEPASADISAEGRAQIAGVARILNDISADIPPEIDWVIRVDGHTDDTPLSGGGRFRDNWELSQGRALSVVRFMTEQLGFPPNRLAANGFGEFQPVSAEDTAEARARNRRIELKLTER